MKRDRRSAIAAGARGATLAALLFACAAQAQETGPVSDYRLPPPPDPKPAPVEGPVDSDHPVAAPTTPAAPPSAAAPAPAISLPATRPEPDRRQAPRADPGRPAAPATPAGLPAPLEPAAPVAPVAPVAPPVPPAEASAAAVSPEVVARPAAGQPDDASLWIAVLAGLAVLAAAAGFLWLRRKARAREDEPVAETADPMPSVPASAPATLTPIGQAAPGSADQSETGPTLVAAGAGPLDVRLEAQSLRLSFVYATLSYRLTLINRGTTALASLRISGDLASGHASLPVGQQLSLAGAQLEPRHDIAALAAGGTVALDGELRVPLADVLPLRAGAALLFAPLARFLIEAERDGGAYGDTRIFTIGAPSERAGDTMQPFRLDQGPQLFRPIDQREVDVARWLTLDATRRAG